MDIYFYQDAFNLEQIVDSIVHSIWIQCTSKNYISCCCIANFYTGEIRINRSFV